MPRYHTFGVNPTFSHDRFHEAHDLIVRAWTEPGPFSFRSRHYQVKYVNLWPRPFQKPHPPIWIPVAGLKETIDWASHPDRRYTVPADVQPGEGVVALPEDVHATPVQALRLPAKDSQLGWAGSHLRRQGLTKARRRRQSRTSRPSATSS